MFTNDEIVNEIKAVIETAYRISSDVGSEVERVIEEGIERPLGLDEAFRLLKRVISVLRVKAIQRGDEEAMKVLEGDVKRLTNRIIEMRKGTIREPAIPLTQTGRVQLISYNGINPSPVRPSPWFQGKEIHMNSGFVKTEDIVLWSDNDRLDIHLNQFRQRFGRDPRPEELLDIMLSRMKLPGLDESDQFKIVDLARSIAVNGVRKPPIVDVDGTLLDGNRRVAACYYILNSDEFTPEEKRRAGHIFVWQLTDHATDDDRKAVVVSLNFEPDHKQDWPDYVKARKVYDEWQAMLAIELRPPGSAHVAEMKRILSKKFALGPDTSFVNRYLKMVDWVNDFEDYHITKKMRDEYEVKHRANRYFQYFDELAKGVKPGGVAYSLNQDEGFKHLVFDLLYDGKFKNWRWIRELRFIYDNEEAREVLSKARNESDLDIAYDHLENAMAIARTRRAEAREVGANTRIESFVKWLEELPVRAFRDTIKPQNLELLLRALRLVERQIEQILREVDPEAREA